MKFLSKKGVLLFAGVMAVCAFVVPAIASADSFILDSGTFPNAQTFTSSNLSFSVASGVNTGSTCGSSTFNVSVTNATTANINSASFGNCHGLASAVNCTVTPTLTLTPWRVTPSTTNLQIHGIHFDIHFENTPNNPTACATPGTVTLTGTLGGGVWNNAEHGITFTNATGTFVHLGAPLPALVNGTLVSDQKNLTIS